MAEDGRAVANFILDFCDARGRKMTNLALQKVVYFCHVWSILLLGRPLVKHKFEAWEFGPVLPYLYRELKVFDRSPITSRTTRLDPLDGSIRTVEYSFDKDTRDLLEDVVEFYTQLSAGYLVDLSHAEGGPWHRVWNHRGAANPGMQINDSDIADFYSKASPPFSSQ